LLGGLFLMVYINGAFGMEESDNDAVCDGESACDGNKISYPFDAWNSE